MKKVQWLYMLCLLYTSKEEQENLKELEKLEKLDKMENAASEDDI